MKRITQTTTNYPLSDYLEISTWRQMLDIVSKDIREDFPKLKEIVAEMIKTKWCDLHLFMAIINNYGHLPMITKEMVKWGNMLRVALYNWMKEIAFTYNELVELDPKDIINYSKSSIKTKTNFKSNDSQFHDAIVQEFANQYVNLEQLNSSEVEQGNNLTILKNLVKYGFGIDIEQVSHRFKHLVTGFWQVKYDDNFEREEFPINE